MRGALYFMAAALVAAAAFWAYRVNYEAQEALSRVAELRARLAHEREAIAVLRAEWAYLSAPERLARLLAAHGGELGLSPLTAASYRAAAELPSPPPDAFWARADPSVFLPAPADQPLLAALTEQRAP